MPKSRTTLLQFALLWLAVSQVSAAIIGTNVPAKPLTQARIDLLPPSDRSAWNDYRERSIKQSREDRSAFADEMRSAGVTNMISPPPARGMRGISLDKPAAWYSSDEAQRIAQIVLSFQTPAGGWSKNLDMTHHRRAEGELFAQGNASHFVTPTDLDLPADPNWNYVGTFDNGATITQLRFLAKIITAQNKEYDTYKKSFLRGLDYVFTSQFPNGGWPQVWPLQGGYHDCVTFNDSAMTGILDLLLDISEAHKEFSFVPETLRQKSAVSLKQGIKCILATQVIAKIQRTAWSQQYDTLTLQPASARNYEMPSISSGESAGIMLFLMRIPQTDTNITAAIHAAAIWFQSTAIRDKAYRRTDANDGRHLVDVPGSDPLWARYYAINDSRPIFGDRDKSIHDTVEEISRERRDGYAWFTDSPQQALNKYVKWKQR